MDEKLTLNDGTELPGSSLICDGNNLFLYVNGLTMARVFSLMNDPEKTRKVKYTDVAGTETACTGYTRLTAVTDEGGGLVTATLKKEV